MKGFKKALSIFLSVILAITSCCVAFFAYAVDDYTSGYDFQIYYYNDSDEFVEVTEQISVMEQYDVQLYACLVYDDGTVWNINSSGMPEGMDNYTVDWTSDARYLAFCEDNDGKVHGYDATKGEAIRNWINDKVATIPVVGDSLSSAIITALDSGTYDIDDLDTEDVIKIVNGILETLNLTDYEEELDASIKEYLDNFDVGITATLKDADGNSVATDTVRVLVLKSDELLSDVVPNAAFIKNYDDIPTKVAVGYEMDLEGIITPVRTHYTCEWTVTGSKGILGSDLASVDENGHFTALSEGTVQVKVSPDVDGMTAKLTEAFNALGAAGELADNESIAKAVLLILGIKSDSDNYTTLTSVITAVLDSGIDVDGVLTFTQENMTPLVNFILYVIYQDAITIEIVAPDAIPITSYEVSGTTEITEGETSEFTFQNVMPKGAVAHDYTVTVENEEYAVQTEKNGMTVLGIDGSTWNNNYISPNKTNLVVSMDGITNTTQLSIYGKNNKKIVYIKLGCDEYLPIDEATNVNPTTYPKRLTASLSYGWVNEDGTYNLATADSPAYTSDGLSYVTADGVLYATGCTVNTLVVQDADGAVATKQIMSGIQTTGVEFTKKHFWLKVNSGTVSTGIRGSVCEMYANILPADASFNTLTFTSEDTESVILSATPLTTAQYTNAALTESRRTAHATATVTCDENGMATVYAYAIGNTSCFANIKVESQTGGFSDEATVAFANVSVSDVTITSDKEDEFKQEDGTYMCTAGDIINFSALVSMSETGSWKDQGFEDVEWTVSDENLASLSSSGVFKGLDVGTVEVTATSVFGEVTDTVSVRILPNYEGLKAAMAATDYENLDSYDWSVDSWNTFDTLYQEATDKIAGNLFNSQKEVDELAENLTKAFEGLVRYMPLEKLEISCSDDSDGNGFATISVSALSNYTNYSTTIVPTVYPLEAEDYKVVYTSSDTSKITVDENGVCHPVSSSDAAWAKITVSVTDPKNGNEFSQDLYVAFAKYQVTSVSVSPSSIDFVGVGEYAETTSATITPSYSTSSAITTASIKYGFFVSSDETVAKVDANGVVTPVGIGNATITFYSYDGGYTATTSVKVTTNKKALKTAIDTADSLVEEFYTEETYANVQTVLSSAKEVYNDDSSTQEQINTITDLLNEALSKLVKNPYANVYLYAGEGGSISFENETYTGDNNKVRVLIADGLTVQAVADEGYHFTRWTDGDGNTISTNEKETFTIDYSANFKAEFEKVYAVTGVKIFADSTDTEYYSKDVATLSTYTSQSVAITSTIEPSNANFYELSYSSSNTSVSISDGKVSPSSNSTCYSFITATVTNTITGEKFSDTVCVAFVKYPIASVSASPSELTFNGVKDSTQLINISYSSSGSQTPSLRQGSFVSQNEDIASVDASGNVTPKSIGSTKVLFTSYNGGKQTTITIKVYADKSALTSAITNANAVNKKNFTETSYNLMAEKLTTANEVYSTEYATQDEVDLATTDLENAYNSLEKLDMVDYTVTISGNGSVALGDSTISESGSFTIKNGEDATFVATPDEDNEFDGWYDSNGNKLSSSLTYTVTVDGFGEVTAKFNEITYVESVDLTFDNNSTNAYRVSVSVVGNYTNYSTNLGVNLNPSNPSHYDVTYYLGEDSTNLSLDGNTLSPSSNEIAYGTVFVKVTDNSNGKEYLDSALVSFSKYYVTGVSPSTSLVTFSGVNASSQNVDITYSSSSAIYNASVRRGIVSVADSSIASVNTAIGSNGTYVVVSPKSIGSTTATFTSYDGGYKTSFNIKVTADKSALSEALTNIKSLDGENYTEETYSAVPQVIEYAQGIYDTEFASQEDVDSATSSITEVISSLVLRDMITINAASTDNGYVEINGERKSSIKLIRGTSVTLSAVADADYMFDGWYDNGTKVSSDATYTFDASEATSLIAKFVPIPYIEKVVATYENDETDFAEVSVPSISRYTNYSATFGLNVYPSNADYEVVSWKLGSVNTNLTLSGQTVKPSSNSYAYGQVIVTVRDNYSGKEYEDVIYVAFAKLLVYSVSVSPTTMTFASPSASSQTITPSYKGVTSVTKPNVQAGFFVSSDETVATVNSSGVVTPVGGGTCTITFYSYDAGHTATTSVTVVGNKVLKGKVVAMESPDKDEGTLGVAGAVVRMGTTAVTTSSDGSFSIEVTDESITEITVSYTNGITRTVDISNKNGNLGSIPIIAVDAVNDGYINAKDYAKLLRQGASEEMLAIFDNFYGFHYTEGYYNQ